MCNIILHYFNDNKNNYSTKLILYYVFCFFFFLFYCTFCSLKLVSRVQIPRCSYRLRFAVGCFCWFLLIFVFAVVVVVIVVALILLTCSVLRVAAAGGARWKEQQAIVFLILPVSKRPLFFCNMSHLARCFSHIAWFHFDLLVFYFFSLFFGILRMQNANLSFSWTKIGLSFSIKMNKMDKMKSLSQVQKPNWSSVLAKWIFM